MTKPLWKHQIRGLEFSRQVRDLALFWDPGCGKSRGMIEILKDKEKFYNRNLRTLILTPLSVIGNWKSELKENGYLDSQIIASIGTGIKRRKQLENALLDSGTGKFSVPRIVIINYDALAGEDLFKILEKWSPEILICDESQRIKNPASARSKSTFKLAKLAMHRYLLTGTPVLKSAEDLFMQFRILDLGESFGNSFWIFRQIYFTDCNASMKHMHNYFPRWEINPESSNKLARIMEKNSFSVKKSDCLSLPPLLKIPQFVEMGSEQKRAYREINDDLVTFIKENDLSSAVVANVAMAKINKLMQIVSGFILKNDKDIHYFKDVPRLDRLEEMLEDLCDVNKVIIWASFKANYVQIRQVLAKLKLGFVEIHGEVPASARTPNLNQFANDKYTRVMLANQASGGIGINMTQASYSIYYSKTTRLEDQLQSEARNYRGGSECHEKVTHYNLITKDTIDVQVNEMLDKKMIIGSNILEHLK